MNQWQNGLMAQSLARILLAMGLVFGRSAWAQQKPVARGGTCPDEVGSPAEPFTPDHVQGLVRAGLGDEQGAKLVEQRRTDFVPWEIINRTRKW